MKHITLFIFFACGVVSAGAQEPRYYYFNSGETAVKTVYGAEGETTGYQEYSILSGAGTRVLGQNVINKPGKKSETTSCHYVCDGGRLMIAMGLNKAGDEMFLDYYDGMTPESGIIESIEFETYAKAAGIRWKITCTISGRTVTAAEETVSSPLGQWKCVRTEYDMELRSRFFGIPVNVHVIEWFAPGFGVVRTDIFRRGKLYETRLLTGFHTSGTADPADVR